MFVIPIIVQFLPDTWRRDVIRFFPDAVGRVLSVTVGRRAVPGRVGGPGGGRAGASAD